MKLNYNVWLTNGRYINTSDELKEEVKEALGDEAAEFIDKIYKSNDLTWNQFKENMDDWEKEADGLSNALRGLYNSLQEILEDVQKSNRLDRKKLTQRLQAEITDIGNYI